MHLHTSQPHVVRPAPSGTRDADARAAAGSVDLEAAGRHYLAQRRALGRKKSTLEDYEGFLRVHLVPFFGDRPLDEIDARLVEEFLYTKLDEGRAPKSVVNYSSLLGAILAHGVRRGWCADNPVRGVEMPRIEVDPDIRFLSLEELDAVLRACPPTPMGQLDRLVISAAAMTGMRRGEVIALRWQDVDWDARIIRVRRNFTRGAFGTPKSRRSGRVVPLASTLAAELRAHRVRSTLRSDEDLVFAHPATGNVLDPSKLSRRFRGHVRRAGVRPTRFHDLRHTFATRMASAGAPMRALQEWLGHGDLRTTLIYSHYALDPGQAAVYAERAFTDAANAVAAGQNVSRLDRDPWIGGCPRLRRLDPTNVEAGDPSTLADLGPTGRRPLLLRRRHSGCQPGACDFE